MALKKLSNNGQLFDHEEERNPLEDRFGVPPFSIFDTMQGYWRERVNAWKKLGIKSEVGRGDNLMPSGNDEPTTNSESNNKYGKCLPNGFDPEKYGIKQSQGTSIFDPVVCELAYTWFMPKNGIDILDPFTGGSVRGVVASVLGKNYTGIDLRQEQIDANYANFEEIKKAKHNLNFNDIRWICGNSLNIKELAGDKLYDFVFSCPPYYDLEVYSEKEGDLSNLSEYSEFLEMYREIIKNAVSLLKENSFACFVVSEIRDKNGVFRNFVGDTIKAFTDCGLHYYNEIILMNSIGTLPIRINNQFNSGRKIGRRHQNILVFYKGDVSKIKSKFGEVILDD